MATTPDLPGASRLSAKARRFSESVIREMTRHALAHFEHDCLAITDEIYEHITFDGTAHFSIATLPGMRQRTITISGMSKTYSVTGWRIGYAIAPPALTAGIRKVHDFLTVGAAAPLQEAGVTALALPDDYYRGLAELYRAKRDRFLPALERAGFCCFAPAGGRRDRQAKCPG